MVYIKTVKRLLTFFRTLRPRKWLLHFNAAEKLILDFSSFNRMKYCIMFPIYIPDMYGLQHRVPDVWTVFIRGYFTCQ